MAKRQSGKETKWQRDKVAKRHSDKETKWKRDKAKRQRDMQTKSL